MKKILLDTTWTKAFFMRDPISRLLSAYMYLIYNPEATEVARNKLRAFGNSSVEWDSFWKAVIAPDGIRDIHWRPQVLIHFLYIICSLLYHILNATE